VEANEKEIKVLAFLPKAMPADELRARFAAIADCALPGRHGQGMKVVMGKAAGRAWRCGQRNGERIATK
jgi:hypothetical protein